MKRFGLFGGTFNPIHIGHLRTACEVQEAFNLDRIYLIPAAIPPHKSLEGVVSAEDRLEMTRLAAINCPDFVVSDVELKRTGPSYTIDTVRHFKAAFPSDTRLYLIVGMDAFIEITSWKSWRELFSLIAFIVMTRPDIRSEGRRPQAENGMRDLEGFLQHHISDGYRFSEERSAYLHPEKQPVYPANVSLLDISSTKIRHLIQEGRTIRFLAPEQVVNFIKTKGLYQ